MENRTLYADRDRQFDMAASESARQMLVIEILGMLIGIEESIKVLEKYRDKLKAQMSEIESAGPQT